MKPAPSCSSGWWAIPPKPNKPSSKRLGNCECKPTRSSKFPRCGWASLDGIETTVVAYTTDIPAFGTSWGQPFLFGPGTIHVAHTLEERVPKQQLLDAVELYQRMVQDLWKRE